MRMPSMAQWRSVSSGILLAAAGAALTLATTGWGARPGAIPTRQPRPRSEIETPQDWRVDSLGLRRIHAFVRSAPEPRTNDRNPFQLSRGPRSLPAVDRVAATQEFSGRAVQVPVAPFLAGIATEDTNAGRRRTAIFILQDGELAFACSGQTVAGLRVIAVSDTSVDLLDTATNTATRLALP